MQDKSVSKLIKKIRKENNLTQKDLAEKLGVTFQAVSKWERGVNLPDVITLKQISREFNISVDDILDGNNNKKNKNMIMIIIISVLLLSIGIGFIIHLKNDKKTQDSFDFKTISSGCEEFKLSGSIAYNESKTSIHIGNIYYCGESSDLYNEIECTLYEKNGNTNVKIDTYKETKSEFKTLEELLFDINFKVANYSKMCENYGKDSLYLEIKAKNKNGNINNFEIPLSLEDDCK